MVVGFGCIGQGVLPLMRRHLAAQAARHTLNSPDSPALAHAPAKGLDTRAPAPQRPDIQNGPVPEPPSRYTRPK